MLAITLLIGEQLNEISERHRYYIYFITYPCKRLQGVNVILQLNGRVQMTTRIVDYTLLPLRPDSNVSSE